MGASETLFEDLAEAADRLRRPIIVIPYLEFDDEIEEWDDGLADEEAAEWHDSAGGHCGDPGCCCCAPPVATGGIEAATHDAVEVLERVLAAFPAKDLYPSDITPIRRMEVRLKENGREYPWDLDETTDEMGQALRLILGDDWVVRIDLVTAEGSKLQFRRSEEE